MANKQSDEYKALLAEYRKMAKRADQRLVRLEGYSYREHFRGVKAFAYKEAMNSIERFSGPGAKRFNTKPPETLQGLRAKMNAIEKFLNSPTSTKRGIEEIYKKRAETFNRNHGTNYTWQEYGRLWESSANRRMMEKFADYGRYLQVLGKMKDKKKKGSKKKKKNEEQDKKDLENNKKIDDRIEEQIEKELEKQGIDMEDLFEL